MGYKVQPTLFVAGRQNMLVMIDDDNSGDFKGCQTADVTYTRNGTDHTWARGVPVLLIGNPHSPVAVAIPVAPTLLSAFSLGFFGRLWFLLTGRVMAGTGSLTGELQKPHGPGHDDLDPIPIPVTDVAVVVAF